MTSEEKDSISHRYCALVKLRDFLLRDEKNKGRRTCEFVESTFIISREYGMPTIKGTCKADTTYSLLVSCTWDFAPFGLTMV